MFLRQAERLARSIDKFRTRFAMRLVCPFDFRDAFADEGVRDDKLRFSVVPSFRNVECVQELLHVLTFDFLNVKAVRLHAFAGVFALSLFRSCVERYGVRVVNKNEIIETPMRGERTSL